MKLLFCTVLTGIVLAASIVPAVSSAEDIPALDQCSMISLHRSAGPYLNIRADGSGALGTGALFPSASVPKRTFDFSAVYSLLRGKLAATRKNAEKPYVSAGFYRKGSGSATLYYLEDENLAEELFATASKNSVKIERGHSGP